MPSRITARKGQSGCHKANASDTSWRLRSLYGGITVRLSMMLNGSPEAAIQFDCIFRIIGRWQAPSYIGRTVGLPTEKGKNFPFTPF